MPSRRSHPYDISRIIPRAAVFAGLLVALANASAVTLAEKAKESGCVNKPMWLAGEDHKANVTGQYFYHLKRTEPNAQAQDPALQDRLIAICAAALREYTS